MTKAKSPKFEQAIEQLEQIIEGVESGDIGLEESLTQYEKGMKLISQCRSILAAAEKRIAELTPDPKAGVTINQGDDVTGDSKPSGAPGTDGGEPD